MTDDEVNAPFVASAAEFNDILDLLDANPRPKLAHYTTIGSLEKIMASDELWFSNPLFMNDLQEMKLGMTQGSHIIATDKRVDDVCETPERAQILRAYFKALYDTYDATHVLNTYVFCLSEHQEQNTDGLLSMWRGYGGHGSGAALIFDTGFLTLQTGSPIVLTKVKYRSDQEKLDYIQAKIYTYLDIIGSNALSDQQLYIAAYHLFDMIKIFALSYKHHGFSEESEWRLIYMPERDTGGLLTDYFHYVVGLRGVEPKLRFPIKPLAIPDSNMTWTFRDILHQLILGPSVSSPLAKASIIRMLQANMKGDFADKVIASTIPLRPV